MPVQVACIELSHLNVFPLQASQDDMQYCAGDPARIGAFFNTDKGFSFAEGPHWARTRKNSHARM